MIDIHTHILPGMDDGARDIHETVEMARQAVKNGTTAVVATPHCNMPGIYDNYFGTAYIEAYDKAVKAIKEEGIPLEIYPGMEVFATHNLPELIVDKKIMPLNQSRYILIEFQFDENPDYVENILKRVREVGARPVIAHPERYEFVNDNPQIAYEWRKNGYLLQVNKGSLQGRFSSEVQKTAYKLLEHSLISVIASDAHRKDIRTANMLETRNYLSEQYAQKDLEVLFRYNGEKICRNELTLMKRPVSFF